jgi:UDP-glucose 4-epimerase
MRHLILGGAGFIGSNLARRLLLDSNTERVVIYDNLSVGKLWRLRDSDYYNKIEVYVTDIENEEVLNEAMKDIDVVWLFAANADIAASANNPSIDFYKGTLLTQLTLEAMRKNNVKKIMFSSGAGCYGDLGSVAPNEDYGPLLPVSPYGANKLASEALICSYSKMFGIVGRTFRFANVVGPMQTHGVSHAFIQKLRNNPEELEILGNGTQSKSYTHIEDVLNAIFLVDEKEDKQYSVYNISNESYIDVKTIAEILVKEMGLKDVKYNFGTENVGWPGDVSIVRFNCEKLRGLGWRSLYDSKQAIEISVKSMLQQDFLV